MFMDTQREKDIELGPQWPFDPINEGECISNSAFATKYEIEADETIFFNVRIDELLDVIIFHYNVLAETKGW